MHGKDVGNRALHLRFQIIFNHSVNTALFNFWSTTTQPKSVRGNVRGSVKFCISGLAQRTHHLSREVTPTIFVLFVVPLFYVVLCVVFALSCLCIIYSIATWWLKSKIGVLPKIEKKVGLACTPSLSADQQLLDSPHYFCVRGCVLKRSESH